MAKILVVDDSRIFRNILMEALTENGHEVIGTASNGQEALDFLSSNEITPELVTLDITMPVMEGLEALKNIRAIYPDMKVIMVSASGQKHKVMEALKMGASDFIQKPFQPEELHSVITKYL
ncbi:MAG: response regulator [Eubacteriales bacterium]